MAGETPLKIEAWPIDKVIPYASNPRSRNEAAVAKVATSIEQYGWRQPIVVDVEGVVIVGHTRLLAARKLGLATVPIHVADLTPAQAKAYRLADNRVADETGWDKALLTIELEELLAIDVDVAMAGFDEQEVADLLAKPTAGATDPDDVPPPPLCCRLASGRPLDSGQSSSALRRLHRGQPGKATHGR